PYFADRLGPLAGVIFFFFMGLAGDDASRLVFIEPDEKSIIRPRSWPQKQRAISGRLWFVHVPFFEQSLAAHSQATVVRTGRQVVQMWYRIRSRVRFGSICQRYFHAVLITLVGEKGSVVLPDETLRRRFLCT